MKSVKSEVDTSVELAAWKGYTTNCKMDHHFGDELFTLEPLRRRVPEPLKRLLTWRP